MKRNPYKRPAGQILRNLRRQFVKLPLWFHSFKLQIYVDSQDKRPSYTVNDIYSKHTTSNKNINDDPQEMP